MRENLVIENISYSFTFKNGIFILKYADNITLSLEIAKSVVALRKELTGHIHRPCLINISGIRSVTEEATHYLLSHDATDKISALAIIINSEIEKLLANFYTSIGTPSIPTKVFDDELSAVRWLYLQKREIKN